MSADTRQCGGKLQRTMSGKTSTVFAHILRGLSGAKITRAKEDVFRGMVGGGCSVRCSYKADDGFLYPLDKAFFYVHKPPMCINHRCVRGGVNVWGEGALCVSGKGPVLLCA
jgi:structure-specific recognition protein 1